MMEKKEKIPVSDSLRYLKAGYQLKAVIDKKIVRFIFRDGLVFVLDGDSFLKLNEFIFLDLYHEIAFEIEDNQDEDTVDMEKDREYYSWRQ